MQDLPPEIILQKQRAILEARKPGKEFDVEATHTGQSTGWFRGSLIQVSPQVDTSCHIWSLREKNI